MVTVPVFVDMIFLPSFFMGLFSKIQETPKSITLIGEVESLLRKMRFSGLRSRWQIPLEWQ